MTKKARKIEGKLSISKSHKNTLNLWFYEVVQGTSQNIFHLVQILTFLTEMCKSKKMQIFVKKWYFQLIFRPTSHEQGLFILTH